VGPRRVLLGEKTRITYKAVLFGGADRKVFLDRKPKKGKWARESAILCLKGNLEQRDREKWGHYITRPAQDSQNIPYSEPCKGEAEKRRVA